VSEAYRPHDHDKDRRDQVSTHNSTVVLKLHVHVHMLGCWCKDASEIRARTMQTTLYSQLSKLSAIVSANTGCGCASDTTTGSLTHEKQSPHTSHQL
jgi:hypothetical protein